MPDDPLFDRLDAEMKLTETLRMFHHTMRAAQAAYAAGLRDGPEACMEWLGNFLAPQGNCPREGADPDWYGKDGWTEGPPWPTPPETNWTVNEHA